MKKLYNDKVCRVKKALYGLKQSPPAWFDKFAGTMQRMGYRQSLGDHMLFTNTLRVKLIALLVYGDGIVVTGDDMTENKKLK